MSENPYQAPQDLSNSGIPVISSAEEIRRAHIKHEASVKSIGLLYYLGGFFLIIAMIASLRNAFSGATQGILAILIPIALVAIGIFQIITAFHLRKLRPWSRIAAIVLSAIGLIGFPIGTIINAYFLYLLLAKKGAFIFSPEYNEVIAATPHVKYKTSVVAWIVLAIVVIAVIALIVGLRA